MQCVGSDMLRTSFVCIIQLAKEQLFAYLTSKQEKSKKRKRYYIFLILQFSLAIYNLIEIQRKLKYDQLMLIFFDRIDIFFPRKSSFLVHEF